MKKNILLYVFMIFGLIFNQNSESIQDQKDIAKSYYNGGFYEDAILTYKNILDVQKKIRYMPKAVIAMVAGYAVGGGHVLHMLCDLTIASDTYIWVRPN